MVSLKSSVDKIVQCFIDTGYQPCTYAFIKPRKRCCPITAIYMKNHGIFPKNIKHRTVVEMVNSGSCCNNYKLGFTYGYDTGFNHSFLTSFYTKEYNKGIKKGIAVRERLKNLKLLKI